MCRLISGAAEQDRDDKIQALDAQVQRLESELEFVKKVHKESVDEMQATFLGAQDQCSPVSLVSFPPYSSFLSWCKWNIANLRMPMRRNIHIGACENIETNSC